VLARIDDITKSVGLIQRHATTIGGQSETLHADLSRLLTQARSALGAGADEAAA
jgi:hypothetical protein